MSLPLYIKLNGTHKQVKTAYVKTNGKYKEVISICYKKGNGWDQIQTHVHTYIETDRVDATCTEVGIITYSCACGSSYTDTIPATGHACGDWYQTIAPTETTEGEKRRDCQNCDYYETETIPVTTHNHNDYEVIILEAVAATCTATGLTEGQKCSGCSEILVAQTVTPKLDHTEVIDKAVEPTCTETGLTEGKHCSVCNTILVAQQTVAALGHSDDNEDGICDKCDTKLCDVNGHTEEVIEAVAPTCTTTGLTEGKKCSVCGEILKKQETVDALGHNTEGWSANSDTHWKTCTRCSEKIDETAHDDIYIKKVQFNSDADNFGYESGLPYHHYVDRWCRTCNQPVALDLETCAETGMWQSTEVIAPTCTTDGYTIKVCECGMGYDNSMAPAFDIKPALGHNTEGVNWSFEKTGTTHYKICTTCGAQVDEEEHDYSTGESKVEVPPTCTEKGQILHTCKCGAGSLQYADALGHEMENIPAKEPTCTEAGNVEYSICIHEGCNYWTWNVDGFIKEVTNHDDVIIPATGHTEVPASTDDACQKCEVCGEVLVASHELEFYSDDAGHGYKCKNCQYIAESEAHIYEDFKPVDETWHNKKCTECDAESFAFYEEHNFVWKLDNGHYEECEQCHYKRNETDHRVDFVEGNPATCTTTGLIDYYVCYTCNSYWDAAGNPIESTDVTLPALGHTSKLEKNEVVHWQECEVCGERLSSEIEHDWKDEVSVQPSCTEAGYGYRTCQTEDCGYSYRYEISATHQSVNHFEAVAPTCTKDGQIEYWKCSSCNKFFSDADCTKEITESDIVVPSEEHEATTITLNDFALDTFGAGSGVYVNFQVNTLDCGTTVEVRRFDNDQIVTASGTGYISPEGNGECYTTIKLSKPYDTTIAYNVYIKPTCCVDAPETLAGTFMIDANGNYS